MAVDNAAGARVLSNGRRRNCGCPTRECLLMSRLIGNHGGLGSTRRAKNRDELLEEALRLRGLPLEVLKGSHGAPQTVHGVLFRGGHVL